MANELKILDFRDAANNYAAAIYKEKIGEQKDKNITGFFSKITGVSVDTASSILRNGEKPGLETIKRLFSSALMELENLKEVRIDLAISLLAHAENFNVTKSEQYKNFLYGILAKEDFSFPENLTGRTPLKLKKGYEEFSNSLEPDEQRASENVSSNVNSRSISAVLKDIISKKDVPSKQFALSAGISNDKLLEMLEESKVPSLPDFMALMNHSASSTHTSLNITDKKRLAYAVYSQLQDSGDTRLDAYYDIIKENLAKAKDKTTLAIYPEVRAFFKEMKPEEVLDKYWSR